MEINFKCKKCGVIFDCDIGAVTLSDDYERPVFQNRIICPKCGQRSIEDVFLTELGQSQLTEATLDFEHDELIDSDSEDSFGHYQGECQGCDTFFPVDETGLCEQCAGKLERDLIRERQWDYSVMAYGAPTEKREELRKAVVDKYGEKLELILPFKDSKKTASLGKRKKRKSKKRNR